MSLLQDIWNCEKCSLHKYCEVSPVGFEQEESLRRIDMMFIFGGPTTFNHDNSQQCVTGVERIALLKLIEKYRVTHHFTRLIKCQPDNKSKTYRKDTIRQCKVWVLNEIMKYRPRCIVGFGKDVETTMYGDGFSINYFPSVNQVLANKQHSDNLNKLFSMV